MILLLVALLTLSLVWTAWRILSHLPAETLASIGPYKKWRVSQHCSEGRHMSVVPASQLYEAVKRDKPSTARVCVMCGLERVVRVWSEANEHDDVADDAYAFFRVRGGWGEPVPYGDGSQPVVRRGLP